MATKLAALIIPVLTLTLGAAVPVRAGLINGSFESFTNSTTGLPSQLSNSGTGGYTSLTGWTIGANTYGFLMAPGTADKGGSYSPQFNNYFSIWGSNNGGSVTLPASSPDGGNFLALDAASGYRGNGISQTLTGLTAGQTYAVTFDWASGQQHGYTGTTTESVQVGFGSQTQTTSVVTNVSQGFTPWQQQTFYFTADGVSDTLNFLAVGTPSGLPPVVLLDGVSFSNVSQVNPSNVAVPEPGSLALVGVGLVVTAAVRRFRRGTPAPE